MDVQKGYKGEVALTFIYRENPGSVNTYVNIPSERISYVMIEHLYENQNVLPVIYMNIKLTSDIYNAVMSGSKYSTFALDVSKRDALSGTSLSRLVVDDEFSYVCSTSNLNYAVNIESETLEAYKSIMVGLVSSTMTNTLRKSFNGMYKSVNSRSLVQMALNGIGKPIVQAPLKNIKTYKQFVVPPVSSRYKLLDHVFENYPFYNSYFTFYMDFDKVYLVPRNGEPVSDGQSPSTVIVNIKDYSDEDGFIDGFTSQNGSYIVNVNAANTKTIVNDSSTKITSKIVGYNDDLNMISQFQVYGESSGASPDANTSKSYVRMDHAGVYKQMLESNSVMVELLKSNVDGDIFTPNKQFNVSNFGAYSKYNGVYYLAYKREFYAIDTGNEYTITTNIGLKKAGIEDPIKVTTNKNKPTTGGTTKTSTTTTSDNGGTSENRLTVKVNTGKTGGSAGTVVHTIM